MMTREAASRLLDMLTVGNVVTAGVRIYQVNWKPYLQIAVSAVLWLLAPFLVLGLLIGITSGIDATSSSNGLGIAVMYIAWFVFLLYGLARYSAESALISRLAFGFLVEQVEPVKAARRYIQQRIWRFLWATTLVGGVLGLVLIGALLLSSILSAIVIGGLGMFSWLRVSSSAGAGLMIISGLLTVLITGLAIALALWFAARLSLVEVPLAIEQGMGAAPSLSRSWSLTDRSVRRVLLILTVIAVLTFPLSLILQVVVALLQQGLQRVIDPGSTLFMGASMILGYGPGVVGTTLFLPLWQATKAVLYYDLRSRNEGYGLKLGDRPALTSPTDSFQDMPGSESF